MMTSSELIEGSKVRAPVGPVATTGAVAMSTGPVMVGTVVAPESWRLPRSGF